MTKKNNIKIQKGDIIDSEMQTIVFPINCTVSTGISPYFKKIYPKMQNYYDHICKHKLLDKGILWLYNADRWLLGFPTKEGNRGKDNIDYVTAGLDKLVDKYKEKGITSIAIPLFDCGKNKKEEVMKLMTEKLSQLDIPVEIWTKTE